MQRWKREKDESEEVSQLRGGVQEAQKQRGVQWYEKARSVNRGAAIACDTGR